MASQRSAEVTLLNSTLSANKTISRVDALSTSIFAGKGLVGSYFYFNLSAVIAGQTFLFVPDFPIYVYDIKVIANGTPVVAEDLVFASVDSAGAATTIATFVALAGLINQVVPLNPNLMNAQEVSPIVNDHLRISSVGGFTGGATVRVYFEKV